MEGLMLITLCHCSGLRASVSSGIVYSQPNMSATAIVWVLLRPSTSQFSGACLVNLDVYRHNQNMYPKYAFYILKTFEPTVSSSSVLTPSVLRSKLPTLAGSSEKEVVIWAFFSEQTNFKMTSKCTAKLKVTAALISKAKM
jgi:hypothetical protein